MEIAARLALAREVWNRVAPRLMGDGEFVQGLEAYRRECCRSGALMAALGVGRSCARCSHERIAGGCCSPAIEEWYELPLLILNLAMGVEFPSRRHFPQGCLFLGPTGCGLVARHHFCVNYLCPHLEGELGPQGVAVLRRQYGRELYRGWLLEAAVIRAVEGDRG